MSDPTAPIVVGYAGTPGSELALDWATEEARRQSRPLTVLHCYDVAHVPALAPASMPEAHSDLLSEVSSHVADAAASRAAEVLGEGSVTALSVLGSPAGELIDASADAHLVVTGSHGRGRILGGLLASTSYAVTAHAKCPAVVVRGDAGTHPDADHRVVVGVDDSPASAHAVECAADVASEAGAALHVVRVIQAPIGMVADRDVRPMLFGETYPVDDARLHEDLRRYAEEACVGVADSVRSRHPDLVVTSAVLEGSAGHAIAKAGAGAGLVVVGSRGRGGFAGMLLGSVSHTVIHYATCPVMVVR